MMSPVSAHIPSDAQVEHTGLAPLIAVCTGYFMVILDVTIVNVAAPAIGRDLSISLTDLQWIVDGYTIAFAGLLLLGGALGDRWGHRRVFCVGVGVFTLASLGCMVAPDETVLTVMRHRRGRRGGPARAELPGVAAAGLPDPAGPGAGVRTVGRHRRGRRDIRSPARRRTDEHAGLALGLRDQPSGRRRLHRVHPGRRRAVRAQPHRNHRLAGPGVRRRHDRRPDHRAQRTQGGRD